MDCIWIMISLQLASHWPAVLDPVRVERAEHGAPFKNAPGLIPSAEKLAIMPWAFR
jgi:hypothetical protein